MSQQRTTEILEQDMHTGWTGVLITAVGAGIQSVKATKGKVAKIIVNTGAINVTPKDGAVAAWAVLTSASGLDLVTAPMQFNTSIQLDFSGAGNAWVLYK